MKKRQKTVQVISTLMLVLVFFTNKTFAQKKNQVEDDVTVVERGQLLSADREYSRAYKSRLYSYRSAPSFSELIVRNLRAGNTTGEIGSVIGESETGTYPGEIKPTTDQFLSTIICSSDAVVAGEVTGKRAVMSEDETIIFTKYDFLVRNILKDNPAKHVVVDHTIEITRPGGLILLDNWRIRFTDLNFELLLNNSNYLLFLKYVPSADGYIVSSSEADFVIENNSFKKLTTFPVPKELINNKDLHFLMNSISRLVLWGCEQ